MTNALVVEALSVASYYQNKFGDQKKASQELLLKLREAMRVYRPSQLLCLVPESMTSSNPEDGVLDAFRALGGQVFVSTKYSSAVDALVACRHLASNDLNPVVLSSSRQSLGLLEHGIALIHPSAEVTKPLTMESWVKKWRIPASSIPLFVALIGDEDLGVDGVVPWQRAAELTRAEGDLDSLLDSGSLKRLEKLALLSSRSDIDARRKNCLLDQRVFESRTPLQIEAKPVKISPEALYDAYQKAGLAGLIPDTVRHSYLPATNMGSDSTYTHVVSDGAVAEALIKRATKAGSVGLDVTSAGDVALSYAVGESWVIESHCVQKEFSAVKGLLECPDIKKVVYDDKSVTRALRRMGVEISGLFADIKGLAYLADSNTGPMSLLETMQHFNIEHKCRFDRELGEGDEGNSAQTLEGASEMCELSLRAGRQIYRDVAKDPGLTERYHETERPLSDLLFKMEEGGVRVNRKALLDLDSELRKELFAIEAKVSEMAPSGVSIKSPATIKKFLYEDLKLSPPPGMKKSTDDRLLKLLEAEHPVIPLIRRARSLSTLISNSLAGLVNSTDEFGIIRPRYMGNLTKTTRLSCRAPNLMAVPSKGEMGVRFRSKFVAKKKYSMIAADYSQIEIQILAHLSKDPVLLRAIRAGIDVHSSTASEVFSVPLDKVTETQRRAAKAVNFGIIYGLSPFGLSRDLGIAREEAEDIISKYFEKYTGVKRYLDGVRESASKNGYVKTTTGRKLCQPGATSTDKSTREASLRAATNAPMQGSAAEIIKRAMVVVDQKLTDSGLDCRMTLQVHDELVFECKNDDLQSALAIIEDGMVSSTQLDVPLKVDIGHGLSWADAHTQDPTLAKKIEGADALDLDPVL